MPTPDHLVRDSRRRAGLSQAELASKLGVSQPAVARLESRGANPRVRTLERTLQACGRTLELDAPLKSPSIDATLVARSLRMSPGERISNFERAYAEVRRIALAGRVARGELA